MKDIRDIQIAWAIELLTQAHERCRRGGIPADISLLAAWSHAFAGAAMFIKGGLQDELKKIVKEAYEATDTVVKQGLGGDTDGKEDE